MRKVGTGYRRESLKRIFYSRMFAVSLVVGIVFVLLVGSLFMLLFERKTNPTIKTYGDAVWLSVVTMTTVGYGDKYPITPAGKVTGMICMVFGIALVTTIITARASVRIEKARKRSGGLDKDTKLHNHFLICGWNNRGPYLIERLLGKQGGEGVPLALLCDLEESPYDDDLLFFFRGSPVSESDLRRVNAGGARAIIILADETKVGKPADIDARTVLCALTIKSINEDARITAEVLRPENKAHLQRAGVGEILDYDMIAGNLMAQSAYRYGLIELVTQLTTKEAGSRIFRVPVAGDLVGKQYDEVTSEFVKSKGYVVAVRRGGRVDTYEQSCVLQEGDILLVISDTRPANAVE